MKKDAYLFDTHALVFWNYKVAVSEAFVKYFDRQAQHGTLYVSSVTFWEVAFLVKKERLAIPDIHAWKDELLNYTSIQLIRPSSSEMIDSTLLPDHHKDPFDRLLIAQAIQNDLILVTQDQRIQKYDVRHIWM